MGSFGENLRREREMRGVSLEEISAATKISVRFLQCVENEEFAKLPGGIFVRSFIRSYARYLGLDEEALLAEYQLVAKDKGRPDISRLAASRPTPPQAAGSGLKKFAILVVIVGLAAGGFALWRYSRRVAAARMRAGSVSSQPSKAAATARGAQAAPPAKTQSPPAESATGSQTNAATVPPQESPTVAPTTSNPAPAVQAPSEPQTSGGLQLQIAATERSWVAVDADGKTVLQGVLEPGQVKSVQAQKSFDVVTGNAQGIVLTLNGQTLKPLGREGEVKSVHLTQDDLKNAGP